MKNIAVYVVVFFIVFFVEFGLNSYLSFSLDETKYLFYQNIINILALFTTLIGFGTPFAVVYMTSLKKIKSNFILTEANLFIIYFFTTIMALLFFLYFNKQIPLYIIIAAALGFFNSIKQNSVNYFLARKEINKSSFVRLNQKLIYIIVVLFLINLSVHFTQMTFGIYLIIGELIGFLILIYKYKVITFKKLTKIKSIIAVSKYSFLANILGMISLALPIIMLNYFDYSGIDIINFSIAFVLLKYSGVLLGPFMQLITPYFTPLKNDMMQLRGLFIKYSFLVFLLGIVVAVILYFLSNFIINTFFSSAYTDAVILFKILVFAIPFLFLNSFSMSFISSVLSIKTTASLTFVTMCLMFLGLFLILKNNLSILYVGYLISIYYFICSMLSIFIVKRRLDEQFKKHSDKVIAII